MSSKKKIIQDSKRRFRSEEQLIVDRFNYYAGGSAKKTKNGDQGAIKELGAVELIPPTNGLENDTINFSVKSDDFSCITFLENYQLMGNLDFKVKYKKYTDDTCTVETATVEEDYLRPKKHSFCLPTSTSLLALFRRAEVSFDTYQDSLSNCVNGDLNWLNRICTLENGFQARRNKTVEQAEYGFAASFNRNIDDLDLQLGNQIAELWPSTDDGKGSRTFYAKIPIFPFRTFPSWVNTKIEKNLGSHMVPENGGLIPPRTEFHLKLEMEKRIPYLMRFTSLLQNHEQAATCGLSENDQWTSWRKFFVLKADGSKEWCTMETITPILKSLQLVIKRIRQVSPWIESHFTQSFTTYRTVLYKMDNSSVQTHFISWDTDITPATMFISFLRDQ